MAENNRAILLSMEEDALGETLRAFTFVGEGFGCYSNFDVRADADEWDEIKREYFWTRFGYEDAAMCAQLGQGYSFEFLGLNIDCCWFWDGDGILAYALFEAGDLHRVVVNSDCKKDYSWVDETDGVTFPNNHPDTEN